MIKIVICSFALLLLFCTIGYGKNEKNCFPDLPSPKLVVTGTENYTANKQDWTRYRLNVKNSREYPNELFATASHLPPCGLNKNSSRTWVSILDNTDTKIYGFCALGRSKNLKKLWFALPLGDIPPESVYITIKDRECDLEYRSNLAPIVIHSEK